MGRFSKKLAFWCGHNNLVLNMLKTVVITMNFRGDPPLQILAF